MLDDSHANTMANRVQTHHLSSGYADQVATRSFTDHTVILAQPLCSFAPALILLGQQLRTT